MISVYDDEEYNRVMEYIKGLASDKGGSFNHWLDLQDESPDFEHPRLVFDMRQELMGNPAYGTLHGGIAATCLDVVGGDAVKFAVYKKYRDATFEDKIKRILKIGTINIRIDYLRPGKGNRFTGTASLVRYGNRVATSQMELCNEQGLLIAKGTGTYTLG